MDDNIPYMTAEIGVLQSQNIDHVLLIYPDKLVIQVEEKDLFATLHTLTANKFGFKSVVRHAEYHVLISF